MLSKPLPTFISYLIAILLVLQFLFIPSNFLHSFLFCILADKYFFIVFGLKGFSGQILFIERGVVSVDLSKWVFFKRHFNVAPFFFYLFYFLPSLFRHFLLVYYSLIRFSNCEDRILRIISIHYRILIRWHLSEESSKWKTELLSQDLRRNDLANLGFGFL